MAISVSKWEYEGNTNVDHLVVESLPFHQRIPPAANRLSNPPPPPPFSSHHHRRTVSPSSQNEIFKEWLLFADKNVNVRERHVIPIWHFLREGEERHCIEIGGPPLKIDCFCRRLYDVRCSNPSSTLAKKSPKKAFIINWPLPFNLFVQT